MIYNMSFLNYFTITELGMMYGLKPDQVEEIRKTAAILQGFGMAIGFFVGMGVAYIVF